MFKNNNVCILSFDIEDWFQVENLKQAIKKEEWEGQKLRVVENTRKLLSILNNYGITATFFVLGWIAEKVPHLIYEIHKLGHEVASHGYEHELIHNLSQEEFRNDLIKSKRILEGITGQKILGYRAPSFSITDWTIDMLKEIGYVYDSSYFPTSFHNRYGKLNSKASIKRCTKNGLFQYSNGLIEVPMPTLNLLSISIPWGGGAYFRLMPYPIFKQGIKTILNKNKLFTFYFHSWEIDNDQPRIKNIKLNYKLRHYTGLKNSYMKLERFLKDFSFTSIRDYLKRMDLLPVKY